jgi:hypothetical protein
MKLDVLADIPISERYAFIVAAASTIRMTHDCILRTDLQHQA